MNSKPPVIEYRFIYAPNPYAPSSDWEPALPGLSLSTAVPVVEVQFRQVPHNTRHDLYAAELEKVADQLFDFGTYYSQSLDDVLDAIALGQEIANELDG